MIYKLITGLLHCFFRFYQLQKTYNLIEETKISMIHI
jgi:hypothetical protein